MANLRFFAELAGQTVAIPAAKINTRTIDGREVSCGWHADTAQWLKIERVIEYKQLASKHVCDDRCMNATGRVMKCECSCGGKNHGKGSGLRTIAREVSVAF